MNRFNMTPGALRAVVFLFCLSAVLGAANLFWTAHEVNAVSSRFAAQSATERARGIVVQRKICATLHALDAEKPPAGGGPANPSRAYLQRLHTRLAELAPDLGCPRPPSGTTPVPRPRRHAAPVPLPSQILPGGPMPVAAGAAAPTVTVTAAPRPHHTPGTRPHPSPTPVPRRCVLTVLAVHVCLQGGALYGQNRPPPVASTPPRPLRPPADARRAGSRPDESRLRHLDHPRPRSRCHRRVAAVRHRPRRTAPQPRPLVHGRSAGIHPADRREPRRPHLQRAGHRHPQDG